MAESLVDPEPQPAPNPRSTRIWGYAFGALGAALFATKAIFIKLAYAKGLDAETFLALRMLFATPIYLAVGVWAWRRRARSAAPIERPALLRAAGIGVLGYYLSSWLDFAGLEHISAQFERLILMTSPIFVIFLGALFFKTPVRMHALVAAALSYAGIAFIFLSGAGGGPGADVPLGTILVLGASIAYAFYQLLAKGVLARLGAWLFTATAMISAGVAVMLHFMITHPLRDLAVTPYVLGLAIAVAIFATVLPTFLIANSIARIGPQATAIVGTISPLCTIGLAVSILGEPFGLPEALGTLLVLGGVGFFTYWDTRRAPKIAV